MSNCINELDDAKPRRVELGAFGSSFPNCPVDRPPYKNQEHTQKAFDVMNILRKQNLLCDVTLIADGIEINAHKMVLAACSPYFFAMFTSFTESKADKITIQGVDGQALQHLIDYVYSAEIQVTEENVQVLLPAANLLQLTDVRDACCAFLRDQLHPTNCLGIRAFADLHGCLELLNHADSYIEQHFGDVVESEEFLALSPAQVCKLISSDKLAVSSEEKVFEAVMSWVNNDLQNRQDYLAQLMEHVRLPLLSQEYLVQRVEEEPLLKSNHLCKDFLIEAMKYHLLKGEQKVMYKTPRTKPRTPIGRPKILLVVGGQAPKAIRSVECYDFKDDKWFQLAELPTRRCRAGLAVLNGFVYAVGGFNGSLRVRTVDVYDPQRDQMTERIVTPYPWKIAPFLFEESDCESEEEDIHESILAEGNIETDVWSQAPIMEARRSTLGVAVLNNCIYAVGGFDGSTGLCTAECFDLRTNQWQMIAPMSTRRSSVGVGVLNGLLYAVGGYDGASRQCLSSVECYNPETDQWSLVAEMSARRSGAGVGVLDGILYAVGGHDGPLVRRSVERYNPETNCWTSVADMKMCRRNAGVVAFEGSLYVVGGDDGSANLPSVEIYCPNTNTWSLLPSYMTIGRSYAGVALLDKPMDPSSGENVEHVVLIPCQ